jgi:hypothetical protein
MDSSPSSLSLKRTLFRLDDARAFLRTLGRAGADVSLLPLKGPVLEHLRDDFKGLLTVKVIGAGVRVTGEETLY